MVTNGNMPTILIRCIIVLEVTGRSSAFMTMSLVVPILALYMYMHALVHTCTCTCWPHYQALTRVGKPLHNAW